MTFLNMISGAEIDLNNPEGQEHNILDISHGLALTNRFVGQTLRPYSVAEHSLLVWELLYLSGAHVRAQLAGLMHDAHEYITGDMSTPFKALIGEPWYAIERAWAASVAHSLGYHNPDTYHYSIIKQADLIALATERRDLKPKNPRAWVCLQGIEPSRTHDLMGPSRTVPACNWEFWRDLFLDKYFELQGACDALDTHTHTHTKKAA